MIRTCAVLVLASLFSACATAAKPLSLCTVPGCIEPDAVAAAPVGAKLEFSMCIDRHGAKHTYRYVKVESGWSLVYYESVLSEECGAKDGASPIIRADDVGAAKPKVPGQ